MNDAEEAPLNLPSGIYEIPLVIQDKRFASSGIKYNPSMGKVMSGFMGETIIVNGEASPIAEVATRFYRLRILNGSNARIYNLALNNNSDLIIIGRWRAIQSSSMRLHKSVKMERAMFRSIPAYTG